MRTNNLLGIIFANVNDSFLPELTEKRSMASLPVAGRYRLIDFSLSSLSNAGVSQVGIITKENYRSLLDHIGNGKEWDLDRKSGGLFILPPFVSGRTDSGIYKTHLEALTGVLPFLTRAKQDYVVICDSDVLTNIDIAEMFKQHIESGADFTIAYKNGKIPRQHEKTMVFTLNDEKRVEKIDYIKERAYTNFSLDVIIMGRQFLVDIINKAQIEGKNSLSKEIIAPNLDKYKVMGYEVTSFAEVMDGMKSYFDLNMKMLDSKVRKQLFSRECPVYTKTHDSMPAKYCIGSNVVNCLIADGCVIEGEVKNCILFRNVQIKKGAVVENSIIMQNAVIDENARVSYAVMDKQSIVSQNQKVEGNVKKIAVIKKGEKI